MLLRLLAFERLLPSAEFRGPREEGFVIDGALRHALR